jgi:EAL domain-containing protein (putative c-di-GMP-specific phosphodiesterase class I)/CheY-like chemotaxis protein
MQIADLRFLVVEDDEFQRNALVRLLKRLQATSVCAAAHGGEALQWVSKSEEPFDIVISDLEMPTMDGMELIRHLGERGYRASLILASALDRALLAAVETMTKTYGITLLGAIEKPVTRESLARILKRHVPPTYKQKNPGQSTVSFTIGEIMAGLEKNEFEPFFQPKIEIRTRRIVGAEALARWRHPQHGIVAPFAFIQALEDNDQIDSLMWAMLKRSSAFCKRLSASGTDATVSVNLSLKSLTDIELASKIGEIATSCGIEPRQLCLEVTESAATTDLGKALENLARLRMKGFGLSIDDYGTGYSSMQQLTRIPFTELKIDRSFVTNAASNTQTKVILASSLDMAKKLGIVAVAEGVETQTDWDLLEELGCDLAQGYFIAKPMPEENYLPWQQNWHADVAASAGKAQSTG